MTELPTLTSTFCRRPEACGRTEIWLVAVTLPVRVVACWMSVRVTGSAVIGLLILQIAVVAIWGIETNRRRLEELQMA